MALAEWRRAYVEDWTFSGWLYMICISPVYLDAWFDCAKAKREVCLGRVFRVHEVLEFGRVCCFSEANYVVVAQTVGP